MDRLKRLTLWCCAALMLSTACSSTNQTTITAAPDGIPAPGGGTAAPTDSTAAPDGIPTPVDGTTAPGDATATPSGETGTTLTDTSETSATASGQDSADGKKSAEPAPFIYKYPELFLTNRNDRSTPLGRLCWAFQEFATQVSVRINRILADNTPNWEVTFPAIVDITEGEDDGVGPVGVVNEESSEPSMGTDGYMLAILDEIQEPSIAGIVDDSGLSKELQLFAEAFFAYIEAFETQVRAVGYENIDRTLLPYQDFEDMPHVKEFSDAAIANSDKCVYLSEDEINRHSDDLEAEVKEYLEETGNIVTIE